MAHKQQIEFCKSVKDKFPEKFIGSVLDVGSLDINGNNRYLFDGCEYTGIDLCSGKNVDIPVACHLIRSWQGCFDIIISTECFEHDEHWKESLQNIIRMLKSNGLFIFTCATIGRKPHGIPECRPSDSPGTNHYYKNLTIKDINEAINVKELFKDFDFIIDLGTKTLMFWGVKK